MDHDRATWEFRGDVIDRLARIETLIADTREDVAVLHKHRTADEERISKLEWRTKLLAIGLSITVGIAGKEHFATLTPILTTLLGGGHI